MVGRQAQKLNVALVSSGLSHVMRGYETFIWDLYQYLNNTVDNQDYPINLTLLKGSGKTTDNIKNVFSLPRSHPIAKLIFPGGGQVTEYKRYRLEQFSMAFWGHFTGLWKQYDILHTCDPNLGWALLNFKKEFNLNYQVIFANCGPLAPEHYQTFDHTQEFTPQYLDTAKDFGISEDNLTLIPMGVDPAQFNVIPLKQQLREKWGIPPNQYVIISVASVDEPFKRLQFLIDALAKLNDSNVFLLMVGQNQNTDYAKETIRLAEQKLAGKFKQLTVPYADIPELYALADMFALASLQEGFGKVYLEAMASGLPVIVHDCPNTRWITGNSTCRINMEDTQAVVERIRNIKDIKEVQQQIIQENNQRLSEQFFWDKLCPQYLDMYLRVGQYQDNQNLSPQETSKSL